MSLGRYWTEDNEEREGEVLDVNGSLVLVQDLETFEEHWIDRRDVEDGAVDDWHVTNGPFGVGA